MIIYATKKTIERYKIKMPEDYSLPVKKSIDNVIAKEQGDRLLEWGAKLFYFNRRKCLEIANFASKFTIFLIDIKVGDLDNVGNLMANYMIDIYKNDPEIVSLLERFFNEQPFLVFSRLTDKSCIAHLNFVQYDFGEDFYGFYDFIENGIFQTRKLNNYFNTERLVTKSREGKKEYIFPAEWFEKLLKERYYKKTT